MKKILEQSIWVKDTSGSKYLLTKGTQFETVDKKSVEKIAIPEKWEKIFEREGYKKFVEKMYSLNPSLVEEAMEDFPTEGAPSEEEFLDVVNVIEPETIDEVDLESNELPGVEEEDVKIETPKPEVLEDPNLVSNELPGVVVVGEKTITIPSSKDFERFLQ